MTLRKFLISAAAMALVALPVAGTEAVEPTTQDIEITVDLGGGHTLDGTIDPCSGGFEAAGLYAYSGDGTEAAAGTLLGADLDFTSVYGDGYQGSPYSYTVDATVSGTSWTGTLSVVGGATYTGVTGTVTVSGDPVDCPNVLLSAFSGGTEYAHQYWVDYDCFGSFEGIGAGPGVTETVTGYVTPDGDFQLTAIYDDLTADPSDNYWATIEGVLTDGAYDSDVDDTTLITSMGQTEATVRVAGSFLDAPSNATCEGDVIGTTTTRDESGRLSWTAPEVFVGKGKSSVTKWKETWSTTITEQYELFTWNSETDEWDMTIESRPADPSTGTLVVACTKNGDNLVQPSFCQQVVPSGAGATA